jgi:hypothetical protein
MMEASSRASILAVTTVAQHYEAPGSQCYALAQMIPNLKSPLLGRPEQLDHSLCVLGICLQVLLHHRVGGTR